MRNNYFKVSAAILILCFYLFPAFLSAQQELPLDSPEKTLSMDFKNASLKDVLKIFSIQSGLNFIASGDIEDRQITMYLDKVPIKDALEKLFKANNLSYEQDEGSNIFIVKDLGRPKVETITRVFFLKYQSVSSSNIEREKGIIGSLSSTALLGGDSGSKAAGEATDLVKIIQEVLSREGKVTQDKPTNSLIVTEIASRMPVIEQLIASLDIPQVQVLLEVEILDVSKNSVDQLGVNWPTTLLKMDMSNAARLTSFPFGGTNKAFNPSGSTLSMNNGTASGWNVSSWTASHFGPTVFTVLGAQLTLDFLKTQTDTKFLARPKLLTLNNETAEIKIVTNEVIGVKSTTDSSQTQSTTTVEAERYETGVSLRVTPQVNPDTGEITMAIIPIVTEANTGPTISGITYKNPDVRITKSMVRVLDGETVVLGGLLRNEFSQVETKLPILSNIPIIGALFRHKGKDKDKERELLVFITPHIVKDNTVQLARSKKVVIPYREQSTASVFNRQRSINSSLNELDRESK